VSEIQPEWVVHVRDVLELLNQGVIITDECPRVVYANSIVLEMIGRSSEDLVGQYVKNLFPSEDVPWLLHQIEIGRAQGQNRFEFYLPKVAGDRLPVVISARQLEDPDGRVFAIVTFTDPQTPGPIRRVSVDDWKTADGKPAPGGTCTAIGDYDATSASGKIPFAITGENGVWGQKQPLPGLAAFCKDTRARLWKAASTSMRSVWRQ